MSRHTAAMWFSHGLPNAAHERRLVACQVRGCRRMPDGSSTKPTNGFASTDTCVAAMAPGRRTPRGPPTRARSPRARGPSASSASAANSQASQAMPPEVLANAAGEREALPSSAATVTAFARTVDLSAWSPRARGRMSLTRRSAVEGPCRLGVRLSERRVTVRRECGELSGVRTMPPEMLALAAGECGLCLPARPPSRVRVDRVPGRGRRGFADANR